jgi:hypothetical protein
MTFSPDDRTTGWAVLRDVLWSWASGTSAWRTAIEWQAVDV